jgi:hypothetical protein
MLADHSWQLVRATRNYERPQAFPDTEEVPRQPYAKTGRESQVSSGSRAPSWPAPGRMNGMADSPDALGDDPCMVTGIRAIDEPGQGLRW